MILLCEFTFGGMRGQMHLMLLNLNGIVLEEICWNNWYIDNRYNMSFSGNIYSTCLYIVIWSICSILFVLWMKFYLKKVLSNSFFWFYLNLCLLWLEASHLYHLIVVSFGSNGNDVLWSVYLIVNDRFLVMEWSWMSNICSFLYILSLLLQNHTSLEMNHSVPGEECYKYDPNHI